MPHSSPASSGRLETRFWPRERWPCPTANGDGEWERMGWFVVIALRTAVYVGSEAAVQDIALRPGENLAPVRYIVEIDAEYGGALAGNRLSARYGVLCRSFTASDRGLLPVLLVFEGCEAEAGQAGEASPLEWSMEGQDALVILGPDNVVREVAVALPMPGAGPAADALAAYAGALWSIPYPLEPLAPGDSFVVDVTDEPSLVGPVLVHRRVVGELVSVAGVEGRQVAVLAGHVEQSMAPDHPTLTGRALAEVQVAIDLATGQVLGVDLVESSETGSRLDPLSSPVVMEPLRCRIRLEGGPDLDALLALP